MVDAVSQTPAATPGKPGQMASNGTKIPPPPIQPPKGGAGPNDQLGLFSPVNQNGCYEFDRVIKSGEVLKRTKKTKNWKPVYLVLRPNLLSIYKHKDETKLRHQISLSELTAVARQKDPKRKAEHVFGLFTPSRNFHLAASSEKEAQRWVELIRQEARIDEEEEEMILSSPGGADHGTYQGFGRQAIQETLSSSSDGEAQPRLSNISNPVAPESMHSARRPSHTLNYSGNEHGSVSDFSDNAGQLGFLESAVSLPNPDVAGSPPTNTTNPSSGKTQSTTRKVSQPAGTGTGFENEDRVVYHGWLYVLRAKNHLRSWKKVWVVLRPKSLALYKNEDEYSANLVIPFSSIIDAVDIDPVSKTKRHCMQIISEDRNYRLCAPNEDILAKWLGGFKSLIAKRNEMHRNVGNVASNTSPPPQSQS